MKTKFFLLGLLSGILLTVASLFVIASFMKNSKENNVEYLEKPVSYENKKTTSFKVFQVLGKAALASELSDKIGNFKIYNGNTVVILGENYYSDQVITIKNPQRVGTYSYTNNGGIPMTVPVIKGNISE